MTTQTNSTLPTTGSQWVAQRRQQLEEALAKLQAFKHSLEEQKLWRQKDEDRLQNVILQMDDFLTALAVDPERSWASHCALVLEGPSWMIPCHPGVWGIREYIWFVDGYLAARADLARTRLCYRRMINSPPAQPIATMSLNQIYRRNQQSPEHFIYEDCENRPEHLRYLETTEKELEKVISALLDTQKPYAPRYKIQIITLQVTGATRLRLKSLKPGMSPTNLLKVTEVADSLPSKEDYALIPLTREHIMAPPSPARDAARHAENDRRSRQYRTKYDSAWRSLTATEIVEILRLLNEV